MALTPQVEEIDGIRFTISQLPGMRGLRVFSRLTKMLGKAGPAAKALISGGTKDAGAVLAILGGMEEEDLVFVAKELLAPCVFSGPADVGQGNAADRFDVLFQGRIDLLFKVLLFALRVNYGSFSKGLSGSAGQAAKAEAPVSSSQNG